MNYILSIEKKNSKKYITTYAFLIVEINALIKVRK